MKLIFASIAALPLMVGLPASADPYKDESGHGRFEHRGYGGKKHKEEYWVGNCKIERKWEGGGYKEERKCEGPRHYHHRHDAPVVIYPPATPPALVIHVPVVIR